jgi:hypothetical protein
MKKILFLLVFTVLGYLSSFSQTLDRITIAAGGISSDSMSATIGELFVFSMSNGGYSLDAGGQSDNKNTGGIGAGITPVNVQKDDNKVLLYPNPVKDIINIQINGTQESALYLVIFDASGKLSLQRSTEFKNGLFSIDVQSLASGIYTMNGYTNSGKRLAPVVFTKVD